MSESHSPLETRVTPEAPRPPRSVRFASLASMSIGRGEYVIAALGFGVLKMAVDALVAETIFGVAWSPLRYVRWPVATLAPIDQAWTQGFLITMFALAAPFAVIGLMLTVGRLRSARLPLWWAGFFLIPYVNWLLFIVLAVLPPRPVSGSASATPVPPLPPLGPPVPPIPPIPLIPLIPLIPPIPLAPPVRPEPDFRALGMRRVFTWKAVLLGSVASGGVLLTGTIIFILAEALGFAVFFATPFASGFISALVVAMQRGNFGAVLLANCFGVAGAAATVLLTGFDGAACILMASPILLITSAAGAGLGSLVMSGGPAGPSLRHPGLLILLLPAGVWGWEHVMAPSAPVRRVDSHVLIAAAPHAVWPTVVAFPPIAEPSELLFALGIAYPTHAIIHPGPDRLDGALAVGAVRECVFSTGPFIEPITVWDPPNRLAFDVTDQPAPMREWSPWAIDPAHLHGFLESRRGEFRLVPLDDGGTRLEGSTWYENRMWPQGYWGLWSDAIIHRIHHRVLDHIRVTVDQ